MHVLTNSLFASGRPRAIGIGYHNVGSGCHRASHCDLIEKIEGCYGQRCGHLPLEAERVHVLVAAVTTEIETQLAYLSQLIGKTITALSPQDLVTMLRQEASPNALVVPYINVPETEHWIQQELGADSWGLAGQWCIGSKTKRIFISCWRTSNWRGWLCPTIPSPQSRLFPKPSLACFNTLKSCSAKQA